MNTDDKLKDKVECKDARLPVKVYARPKPLSLRGLRPKRSPAQGIASP